MIDASELRALLSGEREIPSGDPYSDLYTRLKAWSHRLDVANREQLGIAAINLLAGLSPDHDSGDFYAVAFRALSILHPVGGSDPLARMLRSNELDGLMVDGEPLVGLALLVLAEYGFPSWASAWGTQKLGEIRGQGGQEMDPQIFSFAAALAQAESLAYQPRLALPLIELAETYDSKKKFGEQSSTEILRETFEMLCLRHCAESVFHSVYEENLERMAAIEGSNFAEFHTLLIDVLNRWNVDDSARYALLIALAPLSQRMPSSIMAELKIRDSALYSRSTKSALKLADLKEIDFDEQLAVATTRMIHTNMENLFPNGTFIS
ncbi:MAG TPA: hypothetical protein VJL35_05455 [Gemmatimonadaceae bacterium]|nr:hypothetical protein [Gemmatimonadaceae bacterium]